MKRNLKFEINYDINYTLIGLRSKTEDYQFAYSLNKSSFFLFYRLNKDISYIINKKKIYFSVYKDWNEILKRQSFLISNKSFYISDLDSTGNLFDQNTIANTAFLIPELKEFDYFIKLIGIWKEEEISILKSYLNNMKTVELETTIQLKLIKSINNLVF
ncbi:MAG: hypothetical protein CMP49_00370 [Flavobacteriales bacterium]|nr:hypothetical protein [Flavobacteriales bacterium]|tara:strand:+ start:821 stop:1297 length:477 start_codon:yes stop_codon:yes gene_type:complete